jgi:branched-subunit amino acid transport protein
MASMTLTTLWLTMLAAGLLTYAIRLSFILLLERWQPPDLLKRSLRFVPAAVLAAIILPEMVFRSGSLYLSPANPRLLAGLLAVLIAWRTRNVLVTIAVGMAALLLLQTILK